jgi:ribosomal protein L12E/L44/L45/RPP1/RPP2
MLNKSVKYLAESCWKQYTKQQRAAAAVAAGGTSAPAEDGELAGLLRTLELGQHLQVLQQQMLTVDELASLKHAEIAGVAQLTSIPLGSLRKIVAAAKVAAAEAAAAEAAAADSEDEEEEVGGDKENEPLTD